MIIFDYVHLIMSGTDEKLVMERVKSAVDKEINFFLEEDTILSNKNEKGAKELISEAVAKFNRLTKEFRKTNRRTSKRNRRMS